MVQNSGTHRQRENIFGHNTKPNFCWEFSTLPVLVKIYVILPICVLLALTIIVVPEMNNIYYFTLCVASPVCIRYLNSWCTPTYPYTHTYDVDTYSRSHIHLSMA